MVLPQPHPTSHPRAWRHRQLGAHPRTQGGTDGLPLPLGGTPSVHPSPPPEATHSAPQGATNPPHQGSPMARLQAHSRPGRTQPLPVRPHHPGGLGTVKDMPPPYGQGHTSELVPSGNPTAIRRLATHSHAHQATEHIFRDPFVKDATMTGADTGPTPTPQQTRGEPDGGSSGPPARSSPRGSSPNGTPQTPPVDKHGATHQPHLQSRNAASHRLPCRA